LRFNEDGKSRIQLRADEQTVWLTQLEMAELFDATKQNISLHLKNTFEEGELDPAAAVKESLTAQIEGKRAVRRSLTLRSGGSSSSGRSPQASAVSAAFLRRQP